jgi:hypothetical protein
MKAITQHFIGTTEEWKAANPKLYKAVWGFEEAKEGKVYAKLGDGVNRWNDLKYFDAENIHGLTERLEALEMYPEELRRVGEALVEETAAREEGDLVLQKNIDEGALALQKNIDSEAEIREAADLNILERIEALAPEGLDDIPALLDALQQNINAEAETREAADSALQENINNEVTAREAVALALKGTIEDETAAREAGDLALQENIDNEAAALREMIDRKADSGNALPPGVIISCFINDEWLPYFRLLRMEGQIIDISEESPYYMLGQMIYVGDANNGKTELDGLYKVNESGQRDINGTRMVLPEGRGVFIRGAGVNSRRYGANNTPYDGGNIGRFVGDAIRNFTGYVGLFLEGTSSSGIFYIADNQRWNIAASGSGSACRVSADASRVVPVAHENRPASLSVRYCISY